MLEHQVQRIVSACPVCSRKKTIFFLKIARNDTRTTTVRKGEGIMNAMHKYLDLKLWQEEWGENVVQQHYLGD
jgi:hypothetical protein